MEGEVAMEKQMEGENEEEGKEGGMGGYEEGLSPLSGSSPETGAICASSALCWGMSSPLYSGSYRSASSPPPASMIYSWARPGDLGRITNDGSITLQKK